MTRAAVVCVDDERDVLLSLRDQLTRILDDDYTIELTQSDSEALSLLTDLAEAEVPVPVVICDQMLAGTRGHLLLSQIHQRYPKTRTILLTGLAQLEDVAYAVNHANLYRYLAKPWDEIDLGLTVQAAIRSFFQDQQLAQQNLDLQQANQQLLILNTQLEQKVALRTAELQKQTAQLKASKESAEVANRAKSEFLANMSHEIRTPLNAVLGFAEILEMTPLSADQQEAVQCIMQGGKSLIVIINDILDLSKLEVLELQLTATEFDLRVLIRELVQLFQPQATVKGLAIVSVLPPEMPAQFVGPVDRLRQVLMNLIGNAIKFTSAGRITLQVTWYPSSQAKPETLYFSVQDTGIGIHPSDQARIFEPFVQVDASQTRQYPGTGLGLTICQKIVRLMGGNIQLKSAPGQGAKFWFTVPLSSAADAVAQAVLPTPVRPHRLSANSAIQVLIVEDNPINQRLMLRVLNNLGYQAETVSHGQQALDLLAEQPYDLILMDCQMPVLDGYETTRLLRQREGTLHHTIVIGVTASAMVGDREKCLTAGMDDYLSKPIQVKTLASLLEHWLIKSTYNDQETR